jgi:hypothetical protein
VAVPEECSESKARIVARDYHCCRSRVHQTPSKASAKDPGICLHVDGFTPLLRLGTGPDVSRAWSSEHDV